MPELEDMVARGYFTPPEARAIAARRQAFEYRLKRKAPLLADYLSYIAYEADLDELRAARRARAAEAGIAAAAGPPGLADRAGARRIHFIYARAVRKWRGDLGLWRAWLGHCAATGAARRGSRVAAAALALHPKEPALWAAAAEWEFGGGAARARARGGAGNPAAACALLQRGLRANPECDGLWGDYLRLELAYAATLAARRAVLVGGKKKGGQAEPAPKKARRAPAAAAAEGEDASSGASSGEEDIGAVEGEVVDAGDGAAAPSAAPGTPPKGSAQGGADDDASESAASRRVLAGGVAPLVTRSALAARPASLALRLALLDALHSPDVLAAGPLPGAVEAAGLIYGSLTADFPGEPAAWEAAARRCVGPYAVSLPASKAPTGRRGRGAAAASTASAALPPADAAAAAVFEEGVAACPALWDAYAAFLVKRGAKAKSGGANPPPAAFMDALLGVYSRAAAAGAGSEASLLAWPRAALAAGRVGDALAAAAAATAARPASAPLWKQRLVLEAQAAAPAGGGSGAVLTRLAAEAGGALPFTESGPVWEQAFVCARRFGGDGEASTTVSSLADAFVAALTATARGAGPVSGGLGAAAAAALAAVAAVGGGPPARRALAARIRAAGPPPGAAFFESFLKAEVAEAGGPGALPAPAVRAWFEDAVASYGASCPSLWLAYAAWGGRPAGVSKGDIYWRATKALEGDAAVAAFVEGFSER